MERELLMTGIGGQGVQLAARLLAHALTAAGRGVQLFGSFGGMMRGGNTEATLIAADTAVESPPTVPLAWSAIVMHDAYADHVVPRLRPGGWLLVDSTVCRTPWRDGVAPGGVRRPDAAFDVLEVPATALARDLGSPAAATMVAIGAYARATDIVGADALAQALPEVLPPHRLEQATANMRALAAGYGAVPASSRPAWAEAPA
ncbi:2-oxoacid:acceptor oxidoreductase family protein [Streptomyces bambusae]|uniref:2-oxoacid:acceptor oxidoreductase family protein n=1 Tax=Streptomyces bambusae TaxID=1550616 RepID=UPI001CFC67D5|nr:2-oxoacid:acceptor oxidoreductase family protein [Streptomyces bambusae]MCB5164707.1 2-oxoacid:acceptor oxidoreductase family protein [Streptomyces bambusae]